MKLNVQDRLILSKIVPEKGNFETMDTVLKVREALLLIEEEVAELREEVENLKEMLGDFE